MSDRAAYARATAGYDADHETALTDAILRAIAETSYIDEPPVLCIRTGEIATALVRALALVLALSPSATRSPAAIRELTDNLRRRLIKDAAAAARDPAVNDFVARVFRNDDRERGGRMTPLGTAALKLAGKGFRVFPCIERGKEPAIADNLKRATTDPNTVSGWWRARDFNIGIAVGAGSGIWILDIDGSEGEATLQRLEAENGVLPPTVEVITGKGRHLYFRWPEGTEIRNSQLREDVPGLDWRGNGGFVLAPPSVHPSGRRYAWSVDSAADFADAPPWLIEIVTNKRRGSASTINNSGEATTATAPEVWRSFINERVDGSRRGRAIARFYGYLVRRYVDSILARDIVRMFNEARCDPPLDDAEVVRITEDISGLELKRRGH